MTGLDLDRLEELAEKMPPEPWVWDVTPDRCWAQIHSASAHGGGGEFVGNFPDDDLADFIATLRNAVPSLLAAARHVEAVRVAVHLDDDEPISLPVVPGGHTDHFCDGWDAAVDHMRGLVRAALGTEQEGRGE